MSEKLISADALLEAGRNTSEFQQHLADEYDLECLIAGLPAVDAVEVTYCDQCSNHGHCITKDTFRLAGVEKPFCCVGGRRKENAVD